jgi:DNA modification methylase
LTIDIRIGDCRDVLRQMPADSVHCCVTSPPYFGLRDYGTAQWEGGDAACDHVERVPGRGSSTLTSAGIGQTDEGAAYQAQKRQFRQTCGKCGARRVDRQIGLEPTPDAFVAEMVAVFAEVRRVLRDDGTCWLNLGDSYNQNQGKRFDTNQDGGARKAAAASPKVSSGGLPAKNLLGIPWRVAFALQADGWYLRQDIIWSKPNPMPESVTDRCTKAHEYLFLLSKSPRYWYDQDAIREEPTGRTDAITSFGKPKYADGHVGQGNGYSLDASVGANRRSVWTVATQPFSEAHFATFPPALIDPCIKAGCPVGGTVLDPFGGAGTTGLVADRLGRNAILIELNPAYADMARRRIEGDAGMFAEVAAQ